MPDIFRAGIAQAIGSALGPLVFDVTLIRVTSGTRTVGQLTAGTQPTEVSHVAKGFVDEFDKRQIDGQYIQIGDRKIVILGATLPAGVEPKVGDKVTAEGSTRTIAHVSRDPAGATYECAAR